jgi:hypothetical protein
MDKVTVRTARPPTFGGNELISKVFERTFVYNKEEEKVDKSVRDIIKSHPEVKESLPVVSGDLPGSYLEEF